MRVMLTCPGGPVSAQQQPDRAGKKEKKEKKEKKKETNKKNKGDERMRGYPIHPHAQLAHDTPAPHTQTQYTHTHNTHAHAHIHKQTHT